MPDYNPGPAIIETSFAELQKIVSWINNPGEDPARTKTVLIGGWAVDAYNPYFGSVDIDLVADRNTQQWLIDRLRSDEGYQHHTRYPSDTVKRRLLMEILFSILYRGKLNILSRGTRKFHSRLKFLPETRFFEMSGEEHKFRFRTVQF